MLDVSLYYKNKNKSSKDGLQTQCRTCHLAMVNARRATPEGQAYARQYVATHKDEMRATQARWRAANGKSIAEKARAWYHRQMLNPAYRERRRLYSKCYRATKKLAYAKARREYAKKYYWRDVAYNRLKARERYQRNLELSRQRSRTKYYRRKAKHEHL